VRRIAGGEDRRWGKGKAPAVVPDRRTIAALGCCSEPRLENFSGGTGLPATPGLLGLRKGIDPIQP